MWTPELETLCGLVPGSVKCYADFRNLVHPDDIEAYEAQRDAAVQEHRTFHVELRVIHADGKIRWMLVTGGAVYDGATGEPVRLLGNFVDITGRKLAEEALAVRNAHFDLARRAARVGEFTYKVAAGTMRFAPTSIAAFGSDSTVEITAQQWLSRIHPDDAQSIRAEHIRAFKERRRELVSEFRVVRSGGEAVWLEARSLITYNSAGRAERLTGIYIDVTERRKAEDHKSLLIAELDHRVKNTLATVNAVVSHTRQGSRSVPDFTAALEGRLRSMAATHELLSAGRWSGISLAKIVRGELRPFANGNNIEIQGPEVVLRAEAGQAMAMVLQELATNAAKYGALSNEKGRVSVQWERRLNGQSPSLVLDWDEIDGPPIIAPGTPSYGTSTIRDLIPYEFGGRVDLMFAREGVRCRLELPADWLGDAADLGSGIARTGTK
jgi:PAS domain S-box-containing protein